MEVSNSTGTKSEFRVTGTGGGTEPELLWEGVLEPESRDCRRLDGWTGERTGERKCRVQFFIDKVEVACATFHTLPDVVVLRENAWGHHVEPGRSRPPDRGLSGRGSPKPLPLSPPDFKSGRNILRVVRH